MAYFTVNVTKKFIQLYLHLINNKRKKHFKNVSKIKLNIFFSII